LSVFGSTETLAREGVTAALEKKASDLLVLNLGGVASFADYFVICSASSERHSQAVADAVEERMKNLGRRPVSVEGRASGRWILLDFGEVVFHVFLEEARRFYALERLWGDAGNETRRFASAR
jgi:ribosome-associated protein